MPAELIRSPFDLRHRDCNPIRVATVGIAFGFLRLWNHLEINMDKKKLPLTGPFINEINHSTILDVIAMMPVDPYRPRTSPIIKEEMSHIFFISYILSLWKAVYAKRDGSDFFAVKKRMDHVLFEEKRGLSISPEGTRSLDGRMGPLHPVFVNYALDCYAKGVPSIPTGVDAYGVLPKGAIFPKRSKITVNVGEPLDLSSVLAARKAAEQLQGKTRKDAKREVIMMGGEMIQDAIANLLPEHRRPLSGTPAVRDLKLNEAK